MKSHRAIIILTLMALIVAALGPADAGANSLLSGYGGPGQGNQVILGSTLIGGPSGGGGGSASGGPGSSASSDTLAARSAPTGSTPGSSAPSTSTNARRRARRAPAGGKSPLRADTPKTTPALAGAGDVGSQTLGLSSADVLDIVLALAALIATAGLTSRLVAGRVR